MSEKSAMYYEKGSEDTVKCMLCPHGCILKDSETGICMARKNIDGELYTMNYGKVTSLAVDPIEKKPLKNYYPGSSILSVGSFGCNLKCAFCQNWHISQQETAYTYYTPETLVKLAEDYVKDGNIGIAYTYNEPSIWYEFVHDCAMLAHEHNLKNVMVTNGYIRREPLEKILPLIDAMNIDLKAFSSEFYQDTCKGQLEFVKQTIALCAEVCHVEVTTLIIPGLNDSASEIDELTHWLGTISKDIPLHLTRYHPDYKMHEPTQISPDDLMNLAHIAKRNVNDVYCGNM